MYGNVRRDPRRELERGAPSQRARAAGGRPTSGSCDPHRRGDREAPPQGTVPPAAEPQGRPATDVPRDALEAATGSAARPKAAPTRVGGRRVAPHGHPRLVTTVNSQLATAVNSRPETVARVFGTSVNVFGNERGCARGPRSPGTTKPTHAVTRGRRFRGTEGSDGRDLSPGRGGHVPALPPVRDTGRPLRAGAMGLRGPGRAKRSMLPETGVHATRAARHAVLTLHGVGVAPPPTSLRRGSAEGAGPVPSGAGPGAKDPAQLAVEGDASSPSFGTAVSRPRKGYAHSSERAHSKGSAAQRLPLGRAHARSKGGTHARPPRRLPGAPMSLRGSPAGLLVRSAGPRIRASRRVRGARQAEATSHRVSAPGASPTVGSLSLHGAGAGSNRAPRTQGGRAGLANEPSAP